jgi:hypothetical protein
MFQAILERKYVRHINAYPNSAIGFIQMHFHQPLYLHGDTKINENIIQDLPPQGIVSFLKSRNS